MCKRKTWIQEKETDIIKRQTCINCRNLLSFIKSKQKKEQLTKEQKEQLIKEWYKQ